MLTDPVPLRTTAQLANFDSPQTLPRVYGRLAIRPIKYRVDGRQWLLADHAIQGVDSVYRNGRIYEAWSAVNWRDDSGHSISLLETLDQIESADELTVNLRGLTRSGNVLAVNPADVLYDVLTFSGVAITRSQLDKFRTETQGIELAGVVDGSHPTLRSQIDEIMLSVGAVWSLGMPRIARLWPSTLAADEPHYLTLTALDVDDFETASNIDSIMTALRVLYAYDWAQRQYTRSIALEAGTIAKYGRREQEYSFKWLADQRLAVSLAKRYLRYFARPIWRTRFNLSSDAAAETPPGVTVSVNHHNAVITGAQLVTNARVDILTGNTEIETEAASGTIPAITITQTGAQFADPATTIAVSYLNNVAVITAVNQTTGAIIPGATITLNGITRIADSNGQAAFEIDPGTYTLIITADDMEPITIDNYVIGSVTA